MTFMIYLGSGVCIAAVEATADRKLCWPEFLLVGFSEKAGCFSAMRSDVIGPERHLSQCSALSGVEVKADSKSMASFGCE